jgi:hypothetical protein
VIIDQLDIVDIPVFKAEDDTPIAFDRHGPIALEIAFERVQPVVRNTHGFNRRRNIELGEHHFNPIHQIGPDQAVVAAFEE